MLDTFKTNGSSPPRTYTIKEVRFRVVREAGAPVLRLLDQPAKVAELARELIPDDAREHFFALYLSSRNQLVATHEVSVGTLSGSLVHPREVLGPALRIMGVASLVPSTTTRVGTPLRARTISGSRGNSSRPAGCSTSRSTTTSSLATAATGYVSFVERGLLS